MRHVQPRVLVVVLFTISCAVTLPPPGGPEDKTPPSIVETTPPDSSTGVPAESEFSFTFSESMTRAKVERLVTFYPNVPIGKIKWKKNTLILFPEESLHSDTTYVVVLKAGFRDNHNVQSTNGHRFVFATSAAIDSGVISGTVNFRRKPTKQGVVNLFMLPKDSSFAPEAARPDRQAFTDENGRYTFQYLPTNDTRFIVWAFQDQSKNGLFEPKNEYGEVFPDTLCLSSESSVQLERNISIVDPTEPGEVTGTVANRTMIDSIAVSVTLYAENDTTPPVHYARCDLKGKYIFKDVLAGAYILKAFIDIQPDSSCANYPCFDDSTESCVEPCVQYPDTVKIAPGEKLRLNELTLE